jgi:hypothetical protein
MSPAEVSTVTTKLGEVEARLRGLGSDPDSPVPAGPPPTP